jgi:hypothetical protein
MEPVLKSSQVISHVSVELKPNISEISSVSITRVNVVKGDMSLIYVCICTYIYQSVKSMPLPIGVLCRKI